MRRGAGFDWVALLEAAYEPAPTHAEWASRWVDVARDVFKERERIGVLALRHPPDCSAFEPLVLNGWLEGMTANANGVYAQVLELRGPAFLRDFYYPRGVVLSLLNLLAEMPDPEHRGLERAVLTELGIADTLGIVVHPEPGVAMSFSVGRTEPVVLSRSQHDLLSRIAIHLEAGMRLRLRPESVKAVLTPSGRVEHWEQDAPERDALKEHVQHVESARRAKNRRDVAALDAWTALVRGQVSLVERGEGGRRYYLFVENAPARQPIRALTKGEVDAVAHAARGHSSKMVAYGLGVTESTVSARLAAAANKIGLGSRMDVVRVAAMLARDPRAGFEDIALTTAERDVLELLSLGLTNAEIARMRNRSARTIANQVASLLAKTGAPGRRALVARRVTP